MSKPEEPPPTKLKADRSAKRRNRRRSRSWHRVIGVLLIIPLIWVTITGVILNHGVDWKLDQKMVTHSLVLSAYGMTPEGEPVFAESGGTKAVEWDGQIFWNGRLIQTMGTLVGAVKTEELAAIATDQQIVLLNEDGEMIEQIDELSLPAMPVEAITRDGQSVFIKAADNWYRVDEEWIDFQQTDQNLEPSPLRRLEDEGEMKQLRQLWAQGGLPLSRIVLDLHAGKFLGAFSKYFYDVVALATLWLCVTGLILFFRKPKRPRQAT